MPFKQTIRGPVLYVSWRGFTADELREVTRTLAELRRNGGCPAVYLARLPGDHRTFTIEEHTVLAEFLAGILPSCASIHHVVEGDGFIRSARLAAVTNMAAATTRPRDFYVHATLAEASSSVERLHGVDVSDVAPASRPAPPPAALDVRASGLFRAAARIVGERSERSEKKK